MPYYSLEEPVQKPWMDVEKAATDWDGWMQTLDEAKRADIDRAFMFSTPETLEADRKRFISVASVAQDTGIDAMEISTNFENMYQPLFANQVLGKNEVGVGIAPFLNEIVGRKKKVREEKELLYGAPDDPKSGWLKKARVGGIKGEPWVYSFAKSLQEMQGKPGYDAAKKDAYLWKYASESRAAAEEFSPYRSVINYSVQNLQAMMGVKEGDHDSKSDIAGSIVKEVPKKDRNKVLDAIVLTGSTDGNYKEYAQKLGERISRGAEALGTGLFTFIGLDVLDKQIRRLPAASVPVDSKNPIKDALREALENRVIMDPQKQAERRSSGKGLMPGMRYLTDEELSKAQNHLSGQIDRMAIEERLRGIANGSIDPATSDNPAAGGVLDFAESAPLIASAFIPGGQVFMAGQFARDNYFDLLERFPDMDRGAVLSISLVTAPMQAFTETVVDRFLLGRFPTLSAIARQPVATLTSLLARSAWTIPSGIAIEGAEEVTQQVLPYAMTEVFGALEKDIPDVPWRDIGKGIDENKWKLFWAILPAVVTMSGGANIVDFANGRSLASDPLKLQAAGLSESSAAQISEAARAGEWQKAQDLMRAEWKAGRVETDGAKLETQRETAATAQLSEEQRLAMANVQLEAAGIIPTLRQTTPGKWRMELRDEAGSTLDFDSFESAHQARNAVIEERGINLHESVRQYIETADRNAGVGRAYDWEFNPEQRSLRRAVNEGEVSEAAANRRVGISDVVVTEKRQKPGQEEDTDFEVANAAMEATSQTADDRLASTYILGSNKTEFREGVHRTVVKLYAGATALTVVEEKVEGDADVMLAQGKRDWMIQKLRSYEQQSGDKLFTTQDDSQLKNDDVREAWSHFAVSYFAGKSKRDQSLPDAWKAKGFRKVIADTMRSGMGGVMTGYASFFRSVFRRAAKIGKVRRGGKLDADFEMAIARSLGLEQQIHEAGVAQEAANMAESLSAAATGVVPELDQGHELDPDNAPFAIMPLGPGNRPISTAPAILEKKAFPFADDRAGTDANRWRATWKDWIAGNRAAWRQVVDVAEGPIALSAKTEKEVGQYKRSENIGYHFEAAARLPELLKNSALASVEPYRGPEAAAEIHKRYAWMEMSDGSLRHVMMTVIRWTGEKVTTDSAYSVEAIEVQNNSPTVQNRTAGEAESTPGVSEGETLPTWRDSKPSLQDFLSGIKPEHRFRDIGHSVVTGGLDARLSAMFDPFQRSPELRGRLGLEMQQRANRLRNDWEGAMAANRTRSEINAQRKLMEDQLFHQKSGGITPDMADIQSHPILSEVWGRAMSRGEAKKRRVINEYDDAPPLPRSFYGGARTPDQLAQELHDKGLLPDAYPATMWAQIDAAYSMVSKNAETIKTAQREAKEESRAWAEAAKKTADSPVLERARLLAALRTLDAIISALPSEIRGKIGGYVQIAKYSSDESRLEVIEERTRKIDEELEKFMKKDFTEQFEKVLDRAESKGKPGEKAKGNLGAETHRFFARVKGVWDAKQDDVNTQLAAAEGIIADPSVSDEAREEAFERWTALHQFGAFSSRSAAEMDTALQNAKRILKEGREGWKAIMDARAEERKALRQDAMQEAGGTVDWTAAQVQADNESRRGQLQRAADWFNRHYSFQQVLTTIFGEGAISQRYENRARAATRQKTDAMRQRITEYRDAMMQVFGTRSWRDAQRRLFDLQQRVTDAPVTFHGESTVRRREAPADIVKLILDGKAQLSDYDITRDWTQGDLDQMERLYQENEKLPPNKQKGMLSFETINHGPALPKGALSQFEAMHFSMLAKQEQYRDAMERHGITEETLADIEVWLTPEAKAIRKWLFDQYEAGYAPLNEVYSRMFGVDLPRVKQYAPGYFDTDGKQTEVDPFGSGMEATGLAAGFLKKRKNHLARPVQVDAMQAYWQHTMMTEHWKAWSELSQEMRSVFGNSDVIRTVKARRGSGLSNDMLWWIDTLEQNGVRDAQANEWLAKVMRANVRMGLAYKVSVLLKQLPAAFGSLADVSSGAWVRSAGRVLSGRSAVSPMEMFRTATIQRRIESGYSPEMREAMRGPNARPSVTEDILEWGMQRIAWTDAAFTSFSASVAFDAHFTQAQAQGMSDHEARRIALEQTENTVGRTAQPGELMDRSRREVETNGLGKLLFMFQSANRQAFSLVQAAGNAAISGRGTGRNFGKMVFTYHVLVPVIMQTMAGLVRYLFTDDEPEEAWDPKDYLYATALGPMSGIMVFGAAMQAFTQGFLGKSFGNRSDNPLIEATTKSLKSAEDIYEGDGDMKDVGDLASAIGLMLSGFTNAPTEAAGVTWNVLKQLLGLADSAESIAEGEK